MGYSSPSQMGEVAGLTSLAKANVKAKVKTNIRTREQRNYSEEELKEEQNSSSTNLKRI